MRAGEVLRRADRHGEGNYFADAETLAALEAERPRRLPLLRRRPARSRPTRTPTAAPRNIAGIINERGNVLGMMPHPERAREALLGGADGNRIWESVIGAAVAMTA